MVRSYLRSKERLVLISVMYRHSMDVIRFETQLVKKKKLPKRLSHSTLESLEFFFETSSSDEQQNLQNPIDGDFHFTMYEATKSARIDAYLVYIREQWLADPTVKVQLMKQGSDAPAEVLDLTQPDIANSLIHLSRSSAVPVSAALREKEEKDEIKRQIQVLTARLKEFDAPSRTFPRAAERKEQHEEKMQMELMEAPPAIEFQTQTLRSWNSATTFAEEKEESSPAVIPTSSHRKKKRCASSKQERPSPQKQRKVMNDTEREANIRAYEMEIREGFECTVDESAQDMDIINNVLDAENAKVISIEQLGKLATKVTGFINNRHIGKMTGYYLRSVLAFRLKKKYKKQYRKRMIEVYKIKSPTEHAAYINFYKLINQYFPKETRSVSSSGLSDIPLLRAKIDWRSYRDADQRKLVEIALQRVLESRTSAAPVTDEDTEEELRDDK